VTRRRLTSGPATSPYDLASAVDGLCQLVGRADAFARAAEDLFERGSWGDDGDGDDDERRLDRVAHLLGATVEAVRAAVIAGNQIAAELAGGRVVA
jgi:hypothetical protein